MKFIKNYLIIFLVSSVFFIGCKPKDSEFQAQIEKNLKADPDLVNVSVAVKDQKATFTGEVKDHDTREKASATAKSINGIKEIANNVTITPPAVIAAPVEMNTDNTLMQGVKDATKDFPSVTANVNDGVITLTGNIKRSSLQTLMMSLNTLKPKKIDNQLTIK
ncbi:MAG: BON domain-containing protein [Ginsengibacter sp.]